MRPTCDEPASVYSELSDEQRRKNNCRAYTNVLIRRGTLIREGMCAVRPAEYRGSPCRLFETTPGDLVMQTVPPAEHKGAANDNAQASAEKTGS